MKKLYKNNFYVALIHHPVKSKDGKVIASAVTNLDLHDIARVAKTYGMKAFYVVTPLDDQTKFVGDILDHWIRGYGAKYNPKRREAIKLIKVASSYSKVLNEIKIIESCTPVTVCTTARPGFEYEGYTSFRKKISSSPPETYVFAFGTAWGLTSGFLRSADYILDPIGGSGGYNHLSVRSAVSIVLDRLLGGSFVE